MPASETATPEADRPPKPPVRRTRNELAIVLMLGSIFCLATMEASAKLLIGKYPLPMIVWARFILHFVVTLPVFFVFGQTHLLRTGRPVLHAVRSLILLLASLLFISALSKIPLANATSLVFTAPLIVTALSSAILSEVIGLRRWIAVCVGFVGVIVILRPSADFNWYLLLPLATGFCYAGYQFTTRVLSFTEPTLTLFFYTVTAGAVVSTVALPFFWVTPSLHDAGIFLGTGLFGFLGQYLVIRALQEGEASIVAPFIYTQLIWATTYGFVLFGDFPDLWTFIGAAIVIGSGIYIWHRERLRARAARRNTLAEEAA